jgi:MoxR-like ATPase
MSPGIEEIIQRLQSNMESVVLGKSEVVKLTLVALLAGDHLLLEDVPGVGKTLLGKALARSIEGKFNRIQFTPDLLPSDIVGSSVFHASDGEFRFHPGPIFAHVVLGDEINRAPPKTQSALLEAMSERQVSVDGTTHKLPDPFLVIATQNPYEFEGTYLLPESQLDRFLLRIKVGYPPREVERQVFRSHQAGEPVESLPSVASVSDVLKIQEAVRAIHADDSVLDYLQDIVEGTRNHRRISVGLSTRGALGLYRAGQAFALLERRSYIIPDDIKRLAVPVIAHRLIPEGFSAGTERDATESLVEEILAGIRVPV